MLLYTNRPTRKMERVQTNSQGRRSFAKNATSQSGQQMSSIFGSKNTKPVGGIAEDRKNSINTKPILAKNVNEPPTGGGTKGSAKRFFVGIERNALILTFIASSIAVIIWLIMAFFPGFHYNLNRFVIGSFKRPLPSDPSKYYDVACINIHDYETFKNENQVEMCHNSRPAQRGPILPGVGAK